MQILDKINRCFPDEGNVQTMATLERAITVLTQDNPFVEDILEAFHVKVEDRHGVLQIGNLKSLLDDLESIDSQVEKVNVPMRLKNLEPVRYLKDGVAVFDMMGIEHPKILKDIQSDHMEAESRYSVKTDYMELYRMGKFANFLIDNKKDALLKYNLDELKYDFDKEISVRMVKLLDSGQYLIRAITSEKRYKEYGINFSVLVALLALSDYMKQSHQPVYISHYHVDESKVFVSFAIANKQSVSDSLGVSFNLNLQNDEIKESSVRFDASFRLTLRDHGKATYLDIMPTSYKGINKPYSTNMLTYSHSLTVPKVYERVCDLPKYLDEYVKQVIDLAPNIVNIVNPKEFKKFIINKIDKAHHTEFSEYKDLVINKLISIDVNNVFDLFDALRRIEELFEDDIQSRNYWQKKMYELLVERGRDRKN